MHACVCLGDLLAERSGSHVSATEMPGIAWLRFPSGGSMPGASSQLTGLLPYERRHVLGEPTMLLHNATKVCKELCIHRSKIRPQLSRAWSST